MIGNIPFTETTLFVFQLQNEDFCDSLVYLDLTVHETHDTLVEIYLCPGEVYSVPGGEEILDDSIFTQFLTSIHGCDSIVTIDISTHVNFEFYETYQGCEGDGYRIKIGETWYDESNPTGTENLYSIANCDSVINVQFLYNRVDTTYLIENICEGDTIYVSGLPFTETQTTEIISTNSYNCDSIIYLDLIVQPNYFDQVAIDLCPGDVYIAPDGTVITEPGIHTEFFISTFGCDSIVSYNIIYHQDYQTTETYLGCRGDGYSLMVGNNTYDELTPSGTEFLQSSKGCDSIISVSFEYQSLDSTYIQETLCPYEFYEVGGVEYFGNTSESIFLTSSKNCDSIIFLELENFDSEEIVLENFYDVDLNSIFTFDIPEIDSSIYEWTSDGTLSCDTCANPDLLLEDLPSSIELVYTDKYNCIYTSNATIGYRCTPFFSNVLNIRSATKKNRQFKVESLCPFDEYTMHIFDRWGSLMFASNIQDDFWDGRHNGKYVEQGVYIYQMRYSVYGEPQQVLGSLTVLY